jgi:GMP synthase (glutamine-hydrolysing)
MHVHFIIHEAYEGPGVLLNWVKSRNYSVSSTKLYLGEVLPLDKTPIDLLVVLGGPQCPATTTQECHYFNAEGEITFIEECINAGKSIVGICLGAQLIGEALGARFEKSPYKEIGHFPIALTKSGRQHDKLSHFNEIELVGHWHNDMPGLTSTSKVLATSAGCPRQIIEYSHLVYGFQCHLEFTTESLTALIDESQQEFNSMKSYLYVQNSEAILASDNAQMNALLITFMDKLVVTYKSSAC